jgi:inosine-uridine nucleoside N-ribohydrolase
MPSWIGRLGRGFGRGGSLARKAGLTPPVAAGLTHWWPLKAPNATFAAGGIKDIVGGRNGTPTGLAALPLHFAGAEKVVIAPDASLAGASFSYDALVNPSGFAAWEAIVEYDRSGANWTGLYKSGNASNVVHWRVNQTTGNDAATILSAGADTHLVGTYDAAGQIARLYVNGVCDLQYGAAPPTAHAGELRFGLNATDGEGFLGDLKFPGVSRWSRALTAYEVARKFRALAAVSARNVIIDTDLCQDYDDLAALAIAALLHQAGYINLVAVVTSASNVYSAPCAEAVLRKYGLTGVPIGAYKDEQGARTTTSLYVQQVAARFGLNPAATRADYPAVASVLTAALQANANVTYCALGFLQNLAALLQTQGALAAAKISQIVIMGGAADGVTVEYNFANDPASAAYVFANAGMPILQSPVETGAASAWSARGAQNPAAGADPNLDPIKYAQVLFGVDNRPAWDLIAVLIAGRGLTNHFVAGPTGKVTVNATTGVSTFAAGAAPNLHRQVTLANDPSQMGLICGAIATSLELTS